MLRPVPGCGYDGSQVRVEDLTPTASGRRPAVDAHPHLVRTSASARPQRSSVAARIRLSRAGCLQALRHSHASDPDVDDPLFADWDQDATALEDRLLGAGPCGGRDRPRRRGRYPPRDVCRRARRRVGASRRRSNGSRFTTASLSAISCTTSSTTFGTSVPDPSRWLGFLRCLPCHRRDSGPSLLFVIGRALDRSS